MKFLSILLCLVLPFGALAQDGAPVNAPPLTNAGAPLNGTSEVQTLTIGGTPTAGTFKVRYDGFTTAAITWTATDATLLSRINTALDGLPNLENGEVVATAGTVSSGIGTILLTFGGNRAKLAVNLMVAVSSLTGSSPTAAITETTAGVTATGRGAAKGRLLIDTTNGLLYRNNSGTALAPDWVQAGSPPIAVASADGAISIAPSLVVITKGSAAALTLAAPASQNGTRITVISTTDFAHVITVTGGLWDGTAGANVTATFAAVKGAACTLIAYGTAWYVESLNAVTPAP